MGLETVKQRKRRRLPQQGERWIEVRDPQDDSLIEKVPAAGAHDMRRALERAGAGAVTAARLPVHERMAILNRTADLVRERLETFAVTIAREGSKTIREARKEAARCADTLRLSAEEARRIHGETIPFGQAPGSENRVGYYERFPIGLVGAITPFNDPLNLVAHKAGPAVAAGNAILIKPSSLTPLSALLLADTLREAGLPDGVCTVVTGRGSEVGDMMVRHPAVRMVSFTGGVEAGEAITRKAGLKKLSMELGSNSPVIVLDDADLEEAAAASVSGAFWAAGQNCLGVQRIYVQSRLFDDFAEAFARRTQAYRPGDKMSEQTDMGPMITEQEAVRVERWVHEALRKGAHLLAGGERERAYHAPTALTGVPEDCRIARDEVFGPAVSLFRVTDLDEAVEKANRSPYGLQAGIFTRDLEKAFHVIRNLRVGGVIVNDSSDYRIDAMPFGGTKMSGLGREGVRFAVEEMTETKVVCFRLGSG